MGQILRMEEALDGLVEGCAGRDEDRQDDDEAGDLLGAEALEEEGDAEGNRGQRIAEVVDEVGEERNRAREDEDGELCEGGRREDPQAERDRAYTFARADDRAVDETMGMTMRRVCVIVAMVM